MSTRELPAEGFLPLDPREARREELPPSTRRVFAVGGGKGGIGKSFVAQSLAVYLAQLGKRVVLVDADPTGANLHLSLGVEAPKPLPEFARTRDPASTAPPKQLESALSETNVPGLRLFCAPVESSEGGSLKTAKKTRLLAMLRALVDDDIVIDVGPGTSASACDLFLAADLGVVVTVPEPAAVETAYRFIRAVFVRDLRRALHPDRLRLRTLDRLLGDLPRLPLPIELCKHFARLDAPLGELAGQTLARMRPRLVINQVRVKSDLELGPWMTQVAERRLGVTLDPIGHVEHDDAVWLANRHRSPLLVDNPSSKAGRCVERVARRLLAVLPHRLRELGLEAPPLPGEATHYERLLIPRGASEEEVRRAVKRQREVYAHGGLPTVSLYSREELDREHAGLSEAEDVLLDPARRRAYDVSVFPNHEGGPAPPSPADRVVSEAQAAELRELQVSVSRELGPDTEWSGALLKRVRESRGITLEEIAQKTKVPHTHLAAIETETFSELPSLVYVRGFVAEYAKFLRLDPTQVARTYLRRARDLLEIRGG